MATAWWFSDGRRGHENQSVGLLDALAERVCLDRHRIDVAPERRLAEAWRVWRGAREWPLPDPDLLVGAGHATHLCLLAARRARGGRAIVLMRPSLPSAWFDLRIVPEHDGPRVDAGTLVTRGALNRARPSGDTDATKGLVLLGGPARHVDWRDEDVAATVATIVEREPAIAWTVASSRRTPHGLLRRIESDCPAPVEIAHVKDVSSEWLPAALGRAARVWVTEDSVSMIYEALSAGARTGIIDLPARGAGKLAQGGERLVEEGRVVRYRDWRSGQAMPANHPPLDETGRAAAWVIEQCRIAGD